MRKYFSLLLVLVGLAALGFIVFSQNSSQSPSRSLASDGKTAVNLLSSGSLVGIVTLVYLEDGVLATVEVQERSLVGEGMSISQGSCGQAGSLFYQLPVIDSEFSEFELSTNIQTLAASKPLSIRVGSVDSPLACGDINL